MAKGKKTGGRVKGTPNKVTVDVRRAFADLLTNSIPKLKDWLERVGEDDPARALTIVKDLAEYHIPKLSRTELTGPKGGPVQAVINDPTRAASPASE